MKYLSLIAIFAVAATSCQSEQSAPTLKDYLKDDFLIGAAVNVNHVNGLDPKADSIVTMHFSSIVAENCMKSMEIHPEENVYNWEDADKFVDYGTSRGMAVIGHTLVWHSQLSHWFPYDSAGNYVTPDVLKQRMRDHITTVMTRYKGRIKGWDVVNEAIMEDGSYRKSPFYDILGEEFIPFAFRCAMEADPDAELYINDYNMSFPEKRAAYVKLVNDMKSEGIRVDGIGMQGHNGMDYPSIEEFEKSIVEFGKTGCSVMITEWDMSALPTVSFSSNVSDVTDFDQKRNPYPDGLPAEVSEEWNNRMAEYLSLFRKHSDVISRVTVWGTHDGMSWKNDFPMCGRVDYPLLFDRDYNMKPFLVKELRQDI